MLKKFFWNLLSSFVGAWIALLGFGVLLFFVLVGMIARVGLSAASEAEKLEKHSILKVSLTGVIDERSPKFDLNYFKLIQGDLDQAQSLSTIVTALEEAKENNNIDAVYLECGGVSAGFATLDAIRNALIDFQKSGKKVYAYGDAYTAGTYYVASCADSLFMNPEGSMRLQGISSSVPYMKGFFDKLGVSFQVVKVGTFKSAVEPYIMNEMSEPARAQLDTLYVNVWNHIKSGIAQSRGIQASDIDRAVDSNISFASPQKAVDFRFVDRLIYNRNIKESLARLVGKDDPEKVNFVNPTLLSSQTDWGQAYTDKNQVAVLYATGEISEGSESGINCFKLVPEIVKLADDDNVKALVLRVNSPGGSVFGSAEIAEALQYFKSKKKTFAVSMGDYAASGGYWISCDAERIFADPMTITGSIGIFGLIPEVSGLADKLGVSMQTVSTNPSADFPTLFKPMTPEQYQVMQSYVERGYDRFVKRVAKGRRMSESKVRTIAEGRVWDGTTAKRIGLVDELGGLEEAIKWAARQAKLGENYDVALYPKGDDNIWSMLPTAASARISEMVTKAITPGMDPDIAAHAVEVIRRRPVQARMIPLDLCITRR